MTNIPKSVLGRTGRLLLSGARIAGKELGGRVAAALSDDPRAQLLATKIRQTQELVETLGGVRKDFVRMTLRPEDEGARPAVKVAVLKAFFEGKEGELGFALRRESDEFDYGYALTVHKAQGSQWDDVVLFDESYAFREHRARWLYTGLTRAAKRVTVVR